MCHCMIQTITHVPRMRLCAARMLARMQHVWCIRATDVCTTYVDVCIKKVHTCCLRLHTCRIRRWHVCGMRIRMQNVCGHMLAQRTKCARVQRGRIAAHIKSMLRHEGDTTFQNQHGPACPRCHRCLHCTWVPCLHAYVYIRATYADVCICTGLHTCRIRTHTCHSCNTYAPVEVGLEVHTSTYVLRT